MRVWSRMGMLLVASVVLAALAAPPAHSTSMSVQNLVDLITHSERIFVGEVIGLTDGFDANNLPYTEVAVRVDDSLRGENGSVYTFRQFGLLKPREMPNGLTNLQVSPQGWPTFQEGEEIMLFLYNQAAETGLQTTVGLMQGKFSIVGGQIVNQVDNANLFYQVSLDGATLSPRHQSLVNARGARVAADFISFVRRAVDERWVEQGRMIRAQ